MADPSQILELIATIRSYIDTYGGIVFSFIRRGFILLIYFLMHLPAWIAQAWDFIEQLLGLIKSWL